MSNEIQNENENTMNSEQITENENMIFALDIGTRSVVGVLGNISDDTFSVFDHEQRFHKNRAMRDGQIEDIRLVAKTAIEIKEALEKRNNITLKKVAIAAAGRSLKTMRKTFEQDINEDDNITPELMRSIEYNAVSAALDTFSQDGEALSAYSCVGYDVVSCSLDGYLLSNPVNHMGKHIAIEIIAAFLPFSVVRSLYSVTELCGLTVESLTLEPIAAINAVVPPDIRLFNIAITDIGAGTSDIGISKNGSIVAYDMVTVAGDEVTECIMRHYLVDFDTAESIKFRLSNDDAEITFSDILGVAHCCSKDNIYGAINSVLDSLCDSITESMLKINDGPPTALFLVGGGSQIPGLCTKMANRLNIPEERVTLGGKHPYKAITLYTDTLLTPEYVTPLGIGATSRLTHVHDLFSVTVNGEKVTMPGLENVTVLEALLLAGIKASNLIGRTAPAVIYFLNSERKTLRGTPPVPGEIYVNNVLSSLDTSIRQGDDVNVIFAQNGTAPTVTVSDLCKTFETPAIYVSINGKRVKNSYIIKNRDDIRVSFSIDEIDDNDDFEAMPDTEPAPQPEPAGFATSSDGEASEPSDENENTSDVQASETPMEPAHETQTPAETPVHETETPTETPVEAPAQKAVLEYKATGFKESTRVRKFHICVNEEWIDVPVSEGETPVFLDMLNFVSINTKEAKGDLILSINDMPASYTDIVCDGDKVNIRWSE